MFHIVVRFIAFLLFKIFFRLRVFGRKNFPVKEPVIVASNHVSFLDPILVGVAAPPKLNYLARDTLFKSRFFARILYMLNVSPIKRESGDVNTFRTALSKLSQRKPILIFPEGTRSRDGNLQEPKTGIGFLQVASGASILPCYVKGSVEAWPRHSKFPRVSPVSVYFGRPLKFEKTSGNKRERYVHIAKQTIAAIAKLREDSEKIG